jgi:hypothetical protein
VSESLIPPIPAGPRIDNAKLRVGQPTHELALISALERDVWRLYRPGPGRISFVVFEPEVGAGRPDAIVITVSRAALERFRATGLRVPTPSATRALTDTDEMAMGLSPQYVRSLRRQLQSAGWSSREFDRAANIVHDSLAIEAKMSDWQRALRQVAKFQITVHKSAILMPALAATRIPLPILDSYGIGVIAESQNRSDWFVSPHTHELAPFARLWLLELLIRALESGTAYRPSDLRKRSREPRSDSTLGL